MELFPKNRPKWFFTKIVETCYFWLNKEGNDISNLHNKFGTYIMYNS